MLYYLDTNIIIYAIKNSFPEIKKHFSETPLQSIAIPSIVVAEIEYGAQKSFDYTKTISQYNRMTNLFEKVSFSDDAARLYGSIRNYLEKLGTPIGHNDLIIAATVLSKNGILVTHNTKEFSRVPGLRIEDWTE